MTKNATKLFLSLAMTALMGAVYCAPAFAEESDVIQDSDETTEVTTTEEETLEEEVTEEEITQEANYNDGAVNQWYQDSETGKWYYFDGNGEMVKSAWIYTSNWYYFDEDGSLHTGWLEYYGKKYYIYEDTGTAKGYKTIDGEYYFFDTDNGDLLTNQWCKEVQSTKTNWYYAGEDGLLLRDQWKKINGVWYYFGWDGYMYNSCSAIFKDDVEISIYEGITDGKLNDGCYYYLFDENGAWVQSVGWKQIDGKWYLFGSDNSLQIGWKTIDGVTYYIGNNAVMYQSTQAIFKDDLPVTDTSEAFDEEGNLKDGYRYCVFNSSGAYISGSGWTLIGNTWYYFYPNGSVAASQWLKLGGNWFYFTSGGEMVTGWCKINNEWYYFDANGYMQTGWVTVNGSLYYLDASEERLGIMASDMWVRRTVDGELKWYYASSSGAMLKSTWQKIDDEWYFFNANGYMITGLVKVNGVLYYFNSNGAMATGWQLIGSDYYYFNESGAAITGQWLKYNGKWYFFNSYKMVYSKSLRINGVVYKFGADGALIE